MEHGVEGGVCIPLLPFHYSFFFCCPSDSPHLHRHTPSPSNQTGLLLIIIKGETKRYIPLEHQATISHSICTRTQKATNELFAFLASIFTVIMEMCFGASPRAWELFMRAILKSLHASLGCPLPSANWTWPRDIWEQTRRTLIHEEGECRCHFSFISSCLPLQQSTPLCQALVGPTFHYPSSR